MIDRKEFFKDTVERLPDDPREATALIMATAAAVAVQAGFDDAASLRSLKASLENCRANGLGEEKH